MKLRFINEKDLIAITKTVKFDYMSYLLWLNEEKVCSTAYRIKTYLFSNEQDKRQSFSGIEERFNYAKKYIAKVNMIANSLRDMFIGEKIIFHEYKHFQWIPDEDFESFYVRNILKYLEVDDPSWFSKSGGLITKESLNSVLQYFFCYPYVLRYRELNILNYSTNALLKINHHLALEYIIPES